MQIVGEFPHGAGAVRDGVFLLGGHLREGAVVAVGHEQRVESEPFVSGFAVDDASFDDSFEEALLAAEDQRNDRAETCPAVRNALQAEWTPGAPPSASTSRPVSSAKQSHPVRSWR